MKQYEGEWKYGKMDGMGVYYYNKTGDIYRGSFSKGMRSGNGKLEYPNGDYYIGEWNEDKENGSGSLFLSNGLTTVLMFNLYFFANSKSL